MDLRKYIRDVPDFPVPGVLYRDITPLLREPRAFRYVLDQFSEIALMKNPTAIAAVESRGFIFAAPLAEKLSLPLVPIRKSGKLPCESIGTEYQLEYGTSRLEIHTDSLSAKDTVILVDDLLATGGTAQGSIELIGQLGAQCRDLMFVIELSSLNGREKLRGRHIDSLVAF